jgi:hypothetical protein
MVPKEGTGKGMEGMGTAAGGVDGRDSSTTAQDSMAAQGRQVLLESRATKDFKSMIVAVYY